MTFNLRYETFDWVRYKNENSDLPQIIDKTGC